MASTPPRSRRQRGRPTINDVAQAAGVSPMTVSRVINGDGAVRDATRAKVTAAIAALDYSPSAAARTLAGGEELRLALIYANPSAAYLSELLMGALEGASALNAQLSIEHFPRGGSPAALVAHMQAGRVNGIILPAPLCNNAQVLDALRAPGWPVVAVAAGMMPETVPALGIDDYAAAQTMTRHLIDLGHRRIGIIIGSPDQSASEQRLAGYRAALAQAGLAVDPTLEAQGDFTYRSGLAASARLLDAANPPSAIFACNDDMAAATLAMAHARGLMVPRDLTVCGFDDTPMATTIWPELTTIRQPIRDMARSAVEMLTTMLRARRAEPDAPWPVQHTLMDHALVRRQSDGAPKS
ncbi:substrate-binding domain-containing protein [Novosphingobium sp. FSY-8]|uniref:Substrate-binding domain-containing protein n=1 Tax=Novosphingobium ovatum TaxID=1908523 RepID=A0ABW9XB99_9SPHN|nr:LacI family DNA-binding transcriptional regulator [Novosphingobium ovatum]NBC35813.1 substrate-binding domain-containing protein [Novosphingobium ovatum]